MLFYETPEDLAIVAWFDSLTEETLAALPGYEDGLTPRQAWQAFLAADPAWEAFTSDCLPPATNATGESLAAPALDGQGVGTVPGNEIRRGRPPVHAHAAARKAAYRANLARVDFTDKPEVVAKLKETAEQLDCSVNDLLRSMVRFAQCNRNWKQVGLYGSR
jgi:hypothetical protein